MLRKRGQRLERIRTASHGIRSCLLSIAALVGVLASALMPVPVARAAAIAVNTSTDELNTDGNYSLREAIRAANLNMSVDGCAAGSSTAPDTIILPPQTYTLSISGDSEDAALIGDLDIARDLTISGTSASTTIVDGGAIDRVFEIASGRVTMTNLTIRGGDPGFNSNGGGIANKRGATLTVTNSTISGNSATFGAGIWNEGALTVTDSLISGNGTMQTGGGIANVSGATLTMSGSTLSGNETAGEGGGINNAGVMNITGSAIISNTAIGTLTSSGGGIYNNGIPGGVVLVVTNSTISGNSAKIDGGGIFNILGTVNLNNVTVANNTADSDANGTG